MRPADREIRRLPADSGRFGLISGLLSGSVGFEWAPNGSRPHGYRRSVFITDSPQHGLEPLLLFGWTDLAQVAELKTALRFFIGTPPEAGDGSMTHAVSTPNGFPFQPSGLGGHDVAVLVSTKDEVLDIMDPSIPRRHLDLRVELDHMCTFG